MSRRCGPSCITNESLTLIATVGHPPTFPTRRGRGYDRVWTHNWNTYLLLTFDGELERDAKIMYLFVLLFVIGHNILLVRRNMKSAREAALPPH